MTLDEFLASTLRNSHIEEPGFDTLYVRKARRYFGGQFVDVFDIGSVSVTDRGKGTFTRFLDKLLLATALPIFVENVMEPRFQRYLFKRGFRFVHTDCMILWR